MEMFVVFWHAPFLPVLGERESSEGQVLPLARIRSLHLSSFLLIWNHSSV